MVKVSVYIAFLGIYNHSLGNPITGEFSTLSVNDSLTLDIWSLNKIDMLFSVGAISLALGVVIGAFCQLLWQVLQFLSACLDEA